MKNYSLVILLWIASTTFAISHGITDTNNPETLEVLSVKKVEAKKSIDFKINHDDGKIFITNVSPIKQVRIYDDKGKLIHTSTYLDKSYEYDTSDLVAGKYAFSIQIGDHVSTHIYDKE